jgi:hypothetical protein
MKIQISDNRKIMAIQDEFNRMFPYLKLEFFSKPHKPGGQSPKNLIEHNSKTLAECRVIHKEGDLVITPTMTVIDLEQSFYNNYGLSAHVFRKSGRVWLETTVTDGWTLEEQNREGEALSQRVV